MLAAQHPKMWSNVRISEDKKKQIEPILTE